MKLYAPQHVFDALAFIHGGHLADAPPTQREEIAAEFRQSCQNSYPDDHSLGPDAAECANYALNHVSKGAVNQTDPVATPITPLPPPITTLDEARAAALRVIARHTEPKPAVYVYRLRDQDGSYFISPFAPA